MLPTFVIGLREGVEASLIVGIVAAFLRKQGATRELRAMWAGVALAVALCVGAAVALQILDQELPQRQQEGLETVVAAVAVGMVTFMIVWMRRHARNMAGELRASAAAALASGSAWALVAMAFFAVLREGLETSVFLLAAFQASGNATTAGIGALLGVVAAIGIGYGIYRGGVHLNLTRFFKATAAVLVLVAAGLVASAIHTAHEAAWLNDLQSQAVDLSWLVHPGSVSASLLTGILGLQPKPTVGEAWGYVLYAVPMLLFVLWPEPWRQRLRRRNAAVPLSVVALVVLAGLTLVACGNGGSSGGSGAKHVKVTISDDGCAPPEASIASGPTTFDINNDGSSKVTELELKNKDEIIVGERENIVAGLSGSFTLDVKPGKYTLNCPNAKKDTAALAVTGSAGPAAAGRLSPEAKAATTGYRDYVQQQTAELKTATTKWVATLKTGDLKAAKEQFGPTRFYYEAVEPVAESFGDLDPAIDARENDVASPDQWTGFHRIEKILFKDNTTAGTAKYATKLAVDVDTLDTKARQLDFQPAQLANGAVELLNEVASSKITGEEDRYSHTDLSDFAGNLEGARKAFELLRPALAKTDAKLATTLDARFAAVQTGLDKYKRSTPLGYALYDELTAPDRKQLAAQVDALAEPLSMVAAKVAG